MGEVDIFHFLQPVPPWQGGWLRDTSNHERSGIRTHHPRVERRMPCLIWPQLLVCKPLMDMNLITRRFSPKIDSLVPNIVSWLLYKILLSLASSQFVILCTQPRSLSWILCAQSKQSFCRIYDSKNISRGSKKNLEKKSYVNWLQILSQILK